MGSFYEFFAGGGMARAGLGSHWTCLFANDFDPKKGAAYEANWGSGGEFHLGDVGEIDSQMLPGDADLIWGSFPCQDLSLAGAGAGLGGRRSGTFYPFWRVVDGLIRQGRAPSIIALENVCGTLTSHEGKDFEAICRAFAAAGYWFGALVIDAALFVPQSRPRLFVIGVHKRVQISSDLLHAGPAEPFHTKRLVASIEALPADLRSQALWWRLPQPLRRNQGFLDIIEESPSGVRWHAPDETQRLLDMMSPANRAKLEAARRKGDVVVGGVYKRTRRENGRKVQRAEVRFDDVAGCLRTPAGGSSRQTILIVDGDSVRSRLISPRETARLMGLDDEYRLPDNYNEAYHLTGDGVAVPVVRHLARHVFEPLIDSGASGRRHAA